MDLKCEWCKETFVPKCDKARKRGTSRFCSRKCSGASQRRSSNGDGVSPYRVLVGYQGHPLAFKGGQILEHRLFLYEHIGPGTHPCRWCGALVTWQAGQYNRIGNLVVDHVDENRFNNAPENLVPACGSRNLKRSMKKIVKDTEVFVIRPDGRRARATEVTCAGCGISFLVQSRTLRKGSEDKPRGLYCGRSCANRNKKRVPTK